LLKISLIELLIFAPILLIVISVKKAADNRSESPSNH
jgi:hypothetical protein